MTDAKKLGAPFKEITADSVLYIRCTRSDKAKWVLAAQGNGGLSAWVIDALNKTCEDTKTDEDFVPTSLEEMRRIFQSTPDREQD